MAALPDRVVRRRAVRVAEDVPVPRQHLATTGQHDLVPRRLPGRPDALPAPRAVIGSTVHPFAALGAWLAARWRHARFLFEVRDLWPQTLVDLGAMRVGSPGERILRAMEAFLVRRATVVVTLLPGMQDYLRERGLPTRHVVYIPNGVDLAGFDAPEPSEEACRTRCHARWRRSGPCGPTAGSSSAMSGRSGA